jgi:hypothetical protein
VSRAADPDEGLRLLRAVQAAMATPTGRSIAREIALALRRADEEAAEADPIESEADRLLAKARRRTVRR